MKLARTYRLTRRRPVVAVVAVVALAFPASAPARNHWCRQGDPPILASANTSCPFAGNIVTAYVNKSRPYLARLWRGWVRSPVTRKRYWITCKRTGPADRIKDHVTCTGKNKIWIRFSADV